MNIKIAMLNCVIKVLEHVREILEVEDKHPLMMMPPSTIEYLPYEGGSWQKFKVSVYPGPKSNIYAIRFDNGWEWDAENGWRPFSSQGMI